MTTETFVGSERAAAVRLAELVTIAKRQGRTAELTLAAVIDDYQQSSRVARSTRDRKNKPAIAHIPEAFLQRRVDKMTGRDLARLYRHLADEGVGAPTISTIHDVIRAACTLAIDEEVLDRNPAKQTRLPKRVQRRPEIPTKAEVEAIMAHVATDLQRSLWLRMHLMTGARTAELLALRWSHVHLATMRIDIDGAIERGRERAVKATKTNMFRTIEIDVETVAGIRAWQQAQRVRALELGSGLARDPYLLSDDADCGRPWRADGATQRFTRLRNAAGTPRVHLHSLRHYHASVLISEGVPIPAVSHRLGHASIGTTLRIYAHLIEGDDRRAATAMAAALAR